MNCGVHFYTLLFTCTFTRISFLSPSAADCGQNITHEENGIITSPGYPAPYPPFRQICNWYINVKANHRILLFFEFFLIEGDPASRGCPGAVVRIWKDLASPPIELCGEGLTNDTRQFISSTEMLRLSFITADKAVGSGGFKATWTEIKDPTPSSPMPLNSTVISSSSPTSSSAAAVTCNTNPPVIATSNSNNLNHHLQQHEFRCASNHYCISAKLKCNGIHNCGKYDDSDEANCVKAHEMVSDFLFTGLIAAASLFVCAIFCSVFRRRQRIKRKRGSISSISGNGAPGGGHTAPAGTTASIIHTTGNHTSSINCNGDGLLQSTRRRSSCSSMDFNPVTYCSGGHNSSSDHGPLLATSLTVNCPPPPPPPLPPLITNTISASPSNLISVSSSSSLAGQHLTPNNCPDVNLSTAVTQQDIDNAIDSLDGQLYSHAHTHTHTLPHAHSHHQLRHPVYHQQQQPHHHHHLHHHTLHSHPHSHSHSHSHVHSHLHPPRLRDTGEQHSLHSLSGGNLLMSMETESSSPSPPTSNTTVIAMSTKTQPQPLLSSHSIPFLGSIHDVPGLFDLPVSHQQPSQSSPLLPPPLSPPPPPVSSSSSLTLQRLHLHSHSLNSSSLSPASQYQSHSHIEPLICLPSHSAAGSGLPPDIHDGIGSDHTPGSLTHATTTYIPADSL